MPPGRTLITGAAGFLGSHLAEFLLSRGETVTAMAHRDTGNLDPVPGRLTLFPGDIMDRRGVEATVREARPDTVYHLAAQSLPARSWRAPAATFRVNVLGTLHLLEALRHLAPSATVVVVGSSAEYGFVPPHGLAIREESPLLPASPYGISKVAADLLALLYWRAHGLKTVRVRPFFVIGPGKTGDACSDFARGIVAVERGLRASLSVGNLDAVRDFLYVDDAVSGLAVIAREGEPGQVYNLCAGAGHRVGDVLDILRSLARVPVPLEPDPARLRPLDEPVVIGDNTRLRALGWSPETALQESLARILDYWRQTAGDGAPSPAGGLAAR